MVTYPGTSAPSWATTHTMSVVPSSTSTSPAWSAPATNCSAIASMQPDASDGPSPSTFPHSQPVGTSRGRRSGVMPSSLATAGSHPVKSNSGCASDAVVVSSTASPASAWFATDCAGQKPYADGTVSCSQRTYP